MTRVRSTETMTFIAWALWALALSSIHLLALFESRNAIVCADHRPVFSLEHGADPQSYLLFGNSRLAAINGSSLFPFALRSAPGGIPQASTLRVLDRSNGRSLSALTATIEGRWATIGRVFAWSDQLLVWTYIEQRDPATGNPVRSYRRFLTDGETESELTEEAAYELRAVDVGHQLVASLEERQRVMGGQPKEHELPTQTVRIESLTESEPKTVATFPVRRALRFFFDDGALMVLRWEGEMEPPYWNYHYRIFLDRHEPPNFGTTWSTELSPQSTPQGHGPFGPKFDVSAAQLTGEFELRYLDEVDRLVTREIRVDTTSGEIIASLVQPFTTDWNAASLRRNDNFDWRSSGTQSCLYARKGVEPN